MLGDQVTKRQIVDNILNFLNVVLDGINSLPNDVVLQVEQLEAGK